MATPTLASLSLAVYTEALGSYIGGDGEVLYI